jgi:hypothetical protein
MPYLMDQNFIAYLNLISLFDQVGLAEGKTEFHFVMGPCFLTNNI